jgi:hypothetical protein
MKEETNFAAFPKINKSLSSEQNEEKIKTEERKIFADGYILLYTYENDDDDKNKAVYMKNTY